MMRNPYKLFDYYTYEDRDFFFGREQEVQRMVGEILSTRLLVLFSPSGSGKSSLINAGIRPALEGRDYRTLYVRLETEPSDSILKKLHELPEMKASDNAATLRDTLRRVSPAAPRRSIRITTESPMYAPPKKSSEITTVSPSHPTNQEWSDIATEPPLVTAPEEAIGGADKPPLVIFLDQFEEFFIVFQKQPEIRRRFIDELADIVYDRTIGVYFVLSLRDDYFVRLVEFREAIPSVFQNNANVELRPFDKSAARDAIVNPAKIMGVKFESGLADRIVEDLNTLNSRGDGVLPITLQMVCHTLWENKGEDADRISMELYNATGPSGKLIENYFRKALAAVPNQQRSLMRRLFRALTTPDRTKRLRSLGDLVEILRLRKTSRRFADLLSSLRDAQIVREEHAQGTTWYEFRHDYIATRIADWLVEEEKKLAARRTLGAICLAVAILGLVWIGWLLWEYNVYVVSFGSRDYQDQEEPIAITRKFNPFGFKLDTGIHRSDLDPTTVEAANAIQKGLDLPFGDVNDWTGLQKELSRESRARIELAISPSRADFTALEASEVADAARADGEVLERVLAAKNGDKDQRSLVLNVILQSGLHERAVLDAVVELLKDKESVYSLNKLGEDSLGELARTDGRVIDALVVVLKDKTTESGVRGLIADAFARMQQTDPRIIDALLEVLKDRDCDNAVRRSVVWSLVAFDRTDPRVLDGFLQILSDKDTDNALRRSVAEALVGLGRTDPLAIDVLLDLLKGKEGDRYQRRAAADALAAIGRADPPVIDALAADLKYSLRQPTKPGLTSSRSNSYREQCRSDAEFLIKLGANTPTVIESLIGVLNAKSNSSDLRWFVARYLANLGRIDRPVIETLLAHPISKFSGPSLFTGADLTKLSQNNPELVDQLVTILKDKDAESAVRRATADVLVFLNPADRRVIDPLVTVLKDKDSDSNLCISVINALADLGRTDRLAIDALVTVLKDRNSNAASRTWVANALANAGQGDPSTINALLQVLEDKDSDDYLRLAVATALARIGRADPTAIDALVALLKDKNSRSEVRSSVANALAELGKTDPPVIEVLLTDLKTGNGNLWNLAIDRLIKLGQINPTLIDALVALLKDKNSRSEVRSSVANALAELGKTDPPVIEVLLVDLKTGDSAVQQAALESLIKLGKVNPALIDELVSVLKDKNSRSEARRSVANALAELGKADPPIVETLLADLKDSSVAESALKRLVTLGQTNSQVIDVLVAVLKDKNSYAEVRESVVDALAGLGRTDPPVIEALLADLKAENSNMRLSAVDSLGNLGQSTPPVIEGLLAELKDSQTEVSDAAINSLVKISPKVGWDDESLIRRLQDYDSAWRIAAAHILARRPKLPQAILEEIQALRNDHRPWIRISALNALVERAKEQLKLKK